MGGGKRTNRTAFKVNGSTWLASLSLLERYDVWHVANWTVRAWSGELTLPRLERVAASIPRFDECFDIEVLRRRVPNAPDETELEEFTRRLEENKGEPPETRIDRALFPKGSLRERFPELFDLVSLAQAAIEQSADSLRARAECWLSAIAHDAPVGVDVEAATYLASRGHLRTGDAEAIAEEWRQDIIRGVADSVVASQAVKERAKNGTLTLAEAAKFADDPHIRHFMPYSDSEQMLVAAAVCRAVEHLQLGGFEAWVRSDLRELSEGPTTGLDVGAGSYWLFAMCRSDLALSQCPREELEQWVRSFSNAGLDRGKPWQIALAQDTSRIDTYLFAAQFVFCAYRIGHPKAMELCKPALELLLGSQQRDGSWKVDSKLDSTDRDSSIYTTCVAIHALALARPLGWQAAARRGAQWLGTAQGTFGYWRSGAINSVFLTVLALDSIDLANGASAVTFRAFDHDLTSTIEGASTPIKTSSVDHTPEPPRAPTRDPRVAEALGPLHSVVIGISEYKSTSSFKRLRQCSHDAKAIAQRVQRPEFMGAAERVRLLHGKVSRGEVLGAIREASTSAQTNDRLLFYFSGHGHRIGDQLYLVPSDVYADDDPMALVSFAEVTALLSNSLAKIKIAILDACYTGADLTKFKHPATKISDKFLADYIRKSHGVATLASSLLNQTSGTKSPNRDLSLFTHFVVQALDGEPDAQVDGLLTAQSLFDFVSPAVQRTAKSHHTAQQPVISHDSSGMLVLADFRQSGRQEAT